MKKIILLILAILPMMAGCGSDGNTVQQPTTATLKISAEDLQGTIVPVGAKVVAGIEATIVLPTGVTVKTTKDLGNGGFEADGSVIASGLLKAAGVQSDLMTPVYTPANVATNTKAKLYFIITCVPSTAGVAVGEYATITLNLSGVNPAVSEYSVTPFNAYAADNSGVIPNITPKLK